MPRDPQSKTVEVIVAVLLLAIVIACAYTVLVLGVHGVVNYTVWLWELGG